MGDSPAQIIAKLTKLIDLYEDEELAELSEEILDEFRSLNNLSRGEPGYDHAKRIEKYLRKYHAHIRRGNHAKAGKYLDRIQKIADKMK